MVISIEDFMAMADGSLDGVAAFMTGRLKIKGEMGIAMKLSAILT
jgi:putative sterol carrier protein